MTSRQRTYWFDENGAPKGGWNEIDESDPTFEAVARRLEPRPDPPVDLWRALSRLTDKQKFVIGLRFGYSGHGEHTLDEIAAFMGISHQSVDGILRRALDRLGAEMQALVSDGPAFERSPEEGEEAGGPSLDVQV